MSWTDIAGVAVSRIVSRLARRIAAWLMVGIFGLAALYQATVAATVALELEFGAVQAHLLIAGLYILAAIIILTVLWITSRRQALIRESRAAIARLPPEFQIATIVEALLLGYAMSRRK